MSATHLRSLLFAGVISAYSFSTYAQLVMGSAATSSSPKTLELSKNETNPTQAPTVPTVEQEAAEVQQTMQKEQEEPSYDVSSGDEDMVEYNVPLYLFERSQNYPLWSVGVNLGLSDVTSPSTLSTPSDPGLFWGLETVYRRDPRWSMRASLGQQDVRKTDLGVSYLQFGADFNLPNFGTQFYPYLGAALSLNSVSGYGSDYFRPGFALYLGGDYLLPQASKWAISPRFQYSEVLSKAGRKAVDFWAFFVGISYTFDESEFTSNIKVLHPKR